MGAASAGDTLSVARRTNPPAASIVPLTEWLRVAEKEISISGHPKIGGDLPLVVEFRFL